MKIVYCNIDVAKNKKELLGTLDSLSSLFLTMEKAYDDECISFSIHVIGNWPTDVNILSLYGGENILGNRGFLLYSKNR